MLPLHGVLYGGALMLCWTRCVTLQVTTATVSTVPHTAPCFVDDILAVLREDVGREGELVNSSLALFGICAASDSSRAVLLKLSEEMGRTQSRGAEVLHLSAEEADGGIVLTFDLPPSSVRRLDLVLLLVFDGPITDTHLDLTFTSESLLPKRQSVCVSDETQYILLTGRPSGSSSLQKWRISASTKSSNRKQTLKEIFGDGTTGRNVSVTPLLLFSEEAGIGSRHSPVPASSLQTSFLCELKRFLGSVGPQIPAAVPLMQIDSLQSLPPLVLGSSSSEALLAAMINSSALTIISFSSWGSAFPAQHRELSLSAALLDELRQRLAEASQQMTETIREENVADRAAEKLRRLRDLSQLDQNKTPTGERQFCAFLLLKALKTVVHVYDMKRRMRITRAHSSSPVTSVCGLRSLTVNLEKVLVGPNTANINNCHGSCVFPLTNANNHAIQLNYYIESGHLSERAPCCVPVAYEGLEVMELNQEGTYLSFKPDVIAKECGCR